MYWGIIADNLSEAGWIGTASQLWIPMGEQSSTVDAHRDGQHFIVRVDEELTAFMELESAIHRAITTTIG